MSCGLKNVRWSGYICPDWPLLRFQWAGSWEARETSFFVSRNQITICCGNPISHLTLKVRPFWHGVSCSVSPDKAVRESVTVLLLWLLISLRGDPGWWRASAGKPVRFFLQVISGHVPPQITSKGPFSGPPKANWLNRFPQYPLLWGLLSRQMKGLYQMAWADGIYIAPH